jgi:hypothetical protein
MSENATSPGVDRRFRRFVSAMLVGGFAFISASLLLVLKRQPAGVDFLAIWAGARTALSDPALIYDFAHVSATQGIPHILRPFIYPPSALPILAPFGAAPFWVAYPLWIALSGALFLWASRRVGAPWWLVLFPVITWVALCGQVTFLLAALAILGLAAPVRSPILAGVLLGIAVALKPQLLVFAPIALVAEGRWRTLWASGAAGLAIAALSAVVWGLDRWPEWFSALGRFTAEVIFPNPSMVADAITPYALLTRLGLPGAWAYALALPAAMMVWTTFRRSDDPAARLIVIFGAALLVAPYGMNYEAALLAPGVAAYLARRDAKPWILYAALAGAFAFGASLAATPLLAALALPLVDGMERRRGRSAT